MWKKASRMIDTPRERIIVQDGAIFEHYCERRTAKNNADIDMICMGQKKGWQCFDITIRFEE